MASTGAKMAREAQQLGADAILIFPPYYRTGDEDGLFAYYQMIANGTELPIIPYSRDNAVIGPRLAERLADDPECHCLQGWSGECAEFHARPAASRRPLHLAWRHGR